MKDKWDSVEHIMNDEFHLFRLTIPMVPPSPNVLRRKYKNFFAYKKLREKWEQEIKYMVPGVQASFLKKAAREGRIRVQITFFHSREFDPDNLAGCQKVVLDALRNQQFIKDDSSKWIELLDPEQKKSARKDCKTVIRMQPISELEAA